MSPEPIKRAIGQNALEQHGQFGHGLVAIVFGQFDHAVLDNIQGSVFVSNVINAAFERTFLDALEEIG